MIANSLASIVSRPDYMPFGTELGAGVGGRTTGMGFGVADGVLQKLLSAAYIRSPGRDDKPNQNHEPDDGKQNQGADYLIAGETDHNADS